MKKLLFVFNPHAGRGLIKNNLCNIIDIFTKGGYTVVCYPTQAQRDGYNRIIEIGEEFDVIVVSGGDGTLSEGVRAFMTIRERRPDFKTPLGYIPAGSTNDFANSLGISKKLEQAAQAVVDGKYFDVDIGSFNDEYYVYVAGFGAFTDVSYETPQNAKNIWGHAAYVAEALKRIPKITGQQMTVEHDGEVIEGNFIIGLISNSLSIGGMKKLIADGVCFDDGMFECVLARTPNNPLELNSLLADAALNKLNTKNFVTFKSSKIVFHCENEIAWTIDGEAGGNHKDVTIKAYKQAVRILLNESELTDEQEAVNAAALVDEKNGIACTPSGYAVVIEDQSDIEV